MLAENTLDTLADDEAPRMAAERRASSRTAEDLHVHRHGLYRRPAPVFVANVSEELVVTYRILLIAAALNGALFGTLFIVVPDLTISLFGGQLDALASILVRQLGGVIVGLAIFNWLLRDRAERAIRRAVVTADVAAFTVVAVAAAYAGLTGITNWLVWIVAAFHAAVAVGLIFSFTSLDSRAGAETAAA